MKIFISHSWKNKYEVQQILNELKKFGVDVWIDAEDLLPGMRIQPEIDRQLVDTDLVLLVWSEAAAASKGVLAEIDTCARMEKVIIPFHLDNTSTRGAHPYLEGIKGIHPYDLMSGVRYLEMVITQYMGRQFGINDLDGLQKMQEFRGIMETVGHKIRKEDIKTTGSEAEKDLWERDILARNAAAETSMRQDLVVLGEIQALVKKVFDDLQAANPDQVAMTAIVAQLKLHPLAQHPGMAQFLPLFDNILNAK